MLGRSPRTALPLKDLKVRNRHVRVLPVGLDKRQDGDGTLGGTRLLGRPHKGKPCKLLLGAADRKVYLPQNGFADSYNVSVAAALALHAVIEAYGPAACGHGG